MDILLSMCNSVILDFHAGYSEVWTIQQEAINVKHFEDEKIRCCGLNLQATYFSRQLTNLQSVV
jgi:hypothetical protein